jgi:phosphoglucomutase
MTHVIDEALAGRVRRARDGGLLSEAAASNLLALLTRPDCAAWEAASVADLVGAGEWGELDDRFFRQLQFGTGGLRGRTIGRVVSATERGAAPPEGRPERPAVGANCLNHRAVADATRGLMRHLWRTYGAAPTLVVACDTRHFSPEFARTVADVAVDAGAS